MTDTTKPDLTLNMDEKIYLAVAKNTRNKIAFVYTLACLRRSGNNYDLLATRESNVFKNKASAELFYNAVQHIIDINHNDKNKEWFFTANEDLIKGFNENVR